MAWWKCPGFNGCQPCFYPDTEVVTHNHPLSTFCGGCTAAKPKGAGKGRSYSELLAFFNSNGGKTGGKGKGKADDANGTKSKGK